MATMNIIEHYNQYGYALTTKYKSDSPKRKLSDFIDNSDRSDSMITFPPTPKKLKWSSVSDNESDDESDKMLSIEELDEEIQQFEYEVYGKNNGDFMKNLCGECKVDMGMDEYSQLCGGHYCMA